MIVGWALLVAIGAVLLAGIVRGAVRYERANIRRDLALLDDVRYLASSLARLTSAAYAFAPPLLQEQKSFVGWLWWRTRMRPDGKAELDSGWALTYRRARKAAGAPVDWRSLNGAEIVFVSQSLTVGDSSSAPPQEA